MYADGVYILSSPISMRYVTQANPPPAPPEVSVEAGKMYILIGTTYHDISTITADAASSARLESTYLYLHSLWAIWILDIIPTRPGGQTKCILPVRYSIVPIHTPPGVCMRVACTTLTTPEGSLHVMR